jgi:hypothetical protein
MSSGMWTNYGLVFNIQKFSVPWMISHMAVPVVEHLYGDIFRMYFCSRDLSNRSQIGFFEFNINNPQNILGVSSQPILSHGVLGAFDDCGVTATWVLDCKGKKYLYYVGWSQGASVRMHLYSGLAISEDGGRSFRRYSKSPILERCHIDPFLTATLSIIKEGNRYRMWYVSGDGWEKRSDGTYPFYNIKYAESIDGISWLRPNKICIDYKNSDEHAIARPCVLKENGIYKMWYSSKGSDYCIGYAESTDGIVWVRLDELVNMKRSPDNFDSVMREYPCVIKHKGKKFMFFNGNEYGKYGIGMAEEIC